MAACKYIYCRQLTAFVLYGFFDPFGRAIGLDGVIIMAFVLGFPANETVIPIIIMSYLSTGTLTDFASYEELFALLTQNGWTLTTAICTIVMCIFHFPCSTTCLTIKKKRVVWAGRCFR